ncbi:CobW/HypB/UreG, nucleotide-binding domain [Dillenia turbinata]|uniref:CobW/HypB/UreG, nucleotide-binding domain n=1 Tax=Dillenia turbinata TaxID=194707 RepID=A0AAN8YS23_9MAGN
MENVLTSQHGKRIAIILNEFGEEIGVERAMINEEDGGGLIEEWVEQANGCICCSVQHSLVQALEQPASYHMTCLFSWGPVLANVVRDRIPYTMMSQLALHSLDHILIETTGLANPAPLASVLWLDDQLEFAVRFDSIVTMDNALIDDQRIHVDFSQSVAKLWSQYRRMDNQNGKGNVITDICKAYVQLIM